MVNVLTWVKFQRAEVDFYHIGYNQNYNYKASQTEKSPWSYTYSKKSGYKIGVERRQRNFLFGNRKKLIK